VTLIYYRRDVVICRMTRKTLHFVDVRLTCLINITYLLTYLKDHSLLLPIETIYLQTVYCSVADLVLRDT